VIGAARRHGGRRPGAARVGRGAHGDDLDVDARVVRVWGAESEGTSQLVIDKRRRIVVGATFTGSEVQDMLEAATFAVVGELTLERLRHGVAPFPTRSEVWLNLLEDTGL
jgi:pyruvate/2-oxoglutarate dehydrogenase complex dihydrolipoamide dehydrogenase (E3) component